jgi:2-keto-4-pentenoate hydratase/2-oxohepta-3-ene-1,7-dioic acid hydratase in catechol pathway
VKQRLGTIDEINPARCMKYIRYQDQDGRAHYGAEQADGSALRIDGDIFRMHRVTKERADVAKLLAPIEPTQILGVGLNYRQHAKESNMKAPEVPVLFAKGLNTVQNPGDAILIPTNLASTEVDYECELAVVIGKACKNVTKARALDYVLGYTCANDVSARDWQLKRGGGQWSRGKFFDTFCPLGPRLVTADEIAGPNQLKIATHLNGVTVQDWTTSDMIFDVATLIEFLSGSTTLIPGTVILTGTPHGVGMAAKPEPRWLRPGDEVTIEIEGIGRLTNPVALEPKSV